MKSLKNLLFGKAKFALAFGIVSGFAILALTIIFLLNDLESASIIFWVGISCSLLPVFISTDEQPKACKTSNQS